jgi:hypothetical protein
MNKSLLEATMDPKQGSKQAKPQKGGVSVTIIGQSGVTALDLASGISTTIIGKGGPAEHKAPGTVEDRLAALEAEWTLYKARLEKAGIRL